NASEDGSADGLRSIGELLRAAKPVAAGGTSQVKGIDPAKRSGWTRERRETADRKRRDEGKPPIGSEAPILAVKGEPERAQPAPPPTAKDIEGWAGLMYLGHALGAGLVNIPELRLERGEAQELS